MAYLSFISDKDLENHIKETLDFYRETIKGINLEKFNSNLIDPIKLTFDSIVYNKKIKEIIEEELARQRDKSNTNAIGYFHQKLFSFMPNCEVPQHGFDIIWNAKNHKVYVELKNKHNTMNSSSASATYAKLQNQALKDPTCECFLVEVIAKKSQNIKWSATLNGNPMSHDRIRRVSIDQFYTMITGDKNAFANLCKVLPTVIKKIVAIKLKDKIGKDTVLAELKRKDEDLLKAIYLLAFNTYEGFDNL